MEAKGRVRAWAEEVGCCSHGTAAYRTAAPVSGRCHHRMHGRRPAGTQHPRGRPSAFCVFRADVSFWVRRIGVTPRTVRVRPLRRKWASCSSNGRRTFDLDLLRPPAAVRAVTVVHELLHLRVLNHGTVFCSLVRAYLVEYRAAARTSRS